jgi:dynein heavy chain
VGEYNKNIINIDGSFRVVLCNKSRNPNVSGKLYINHPVLNFEITRKILKQRLIRELIMLENKEVYNIQKELEMETKSNGKAILEFEKQIIESLINSKRNLIEDNDFISLLQQDHLRRTYLKTAELECHQKTIAIKRIVDNYENLTEQTSKIFISLKQMSKINSVLSWNTDIFVDYFTKAVQESITERLFEEDDE